MASPRRRPPCPEAPFLRGARREKGPTGDARLVLPAALCLPCPETRLPCDFGGENARLVFVQGAPSPCLTATFTAPRCPLRSIAALCLPCPETRLPCDFGGENARRLFVQGAPSPSPRGCPPHCRPVAAAFTGPPPSPPPLPLAHRCAALSSIPRPCLPRPVPSPAASPFAPPFRAGLFSGAGRRSARLRRFFHAESRPCLPRFGRRLRQRLRAFQKRAFHARSDKNRLCRFPLRTGKKETFSLISSAQEKNHIHNNTIRHRFFPSKNRFHTTIFRYFSSFFIFMFIFHSRTYIIFIKSHLS